MKSKSVYLKAAKLIDSNKEKFCCHAIASVTDRNKEYEKYGKDLERRFWDETFQPANTRWNTWASISICYGEDDDLMADTWRQERVLALCFAAAMAEAGDL